jgi:hypothetical protein
VSAFTLVPSCEPVSRLSFDHEIKNSLVCGFSTTSVRSCRKHASPLSNIVWEIQ